MEASRASRLVDPARLRAVRSAGLLDTRADEAFDRLARLAAMLLWDERT